MKKYICLTLSVLAFVATFFMIWFFSELLDRYFIFVLIPFGFTIVFWLISVIINIFGIVKCDDRDRKTFIHYIALAISVLTVIIVFVFPFSEAKFHLEYKLYAKERQKVVEMVKDDSISSVDLGIVELPKEFDHITSEGSIYVFQNDEEQVIGFWIFRGMLSGSKILVYSSQDDSLIYENETGHPITNVEKMEEHWYLVETDY